MDFCCHIRNETVFNESQTLGCLAKDKRKGINASSRIQIYRKLLVIRKCHVFHDLNSINAAAKRQNIFKYHTKFLPPKKKH